MPAMPKSGPALFLGLELAVDQLRASIVDESLELVGVECVDFDSELSEYQTQGGIFTTPGDAYTTPIEMWIKGLDILLEKLHRNHDLSKIKSIGGAAQHALVWWRSTTVPSLSSLDAHTPFHAHFTAHNFSLPNTPIAQDTSSHPHALVLEDLLGGPDHMAARVGTCANSSLVAAQLLRVRESWPQEVWNRTGRIQLASAFLSSLISGKWMSMGEAEACATGMWVHGGNSSPVTLGQTQPLGQGYWDEAVLDIVGGSREEGRRVRGWLGEVDTTGGARRAGNISRYLVERYNFDPETIVAPFTSDYLASFLSLCPSPNDAVLSFGPMDTLMTPAQHYYPTRLYSLFPHPAQDGGEKRRYIAVLSNRNADVPRALVRDMYTKSWSAFDRLVAIVPPGGSIGLDDKLFSFWHLQGDSYPYSHVKGIYRFETGIKVEEFRDLRANPRCLLESQVISFRVRWSRMIATGLLGTARKGGGGGLNPTPPLPGRSSSLTSSLGLPFDPYDHTPLPTRVLATGAAANFPSVANLVGDVFNAPVFVPNTQVDSAQVVPHRNAPAAGFPGRAALGGAYMARWVWGKEWGSGGLGAFEDEIRRLLGKRWVASGGLPVRTNVNSMSGLSLVGLVGGIGSGGGAGTGTGGGGSGANSGTSTPFGHSRSNLGTAIFAEEDEDAALEAERNGGGLSGPGVLATAGIYGSGYQHHQQQLHHHLGESGMGSALGTTTARMRTHTGSTIDTISSGGGGGIGGGNSSSVATPSTAYTTPDLNLGMISPGLGSASSNGSLIGMNMGTTGTTTTTTTALTTTTTTTTTPTTPIPLTPVVALPTSDAEAQIGLAKVAEPDLDAFMTYAAIVPEYCRLEGMVVKGIV